MDFPSNTNEERRGSRSRPEKKVEKVIEGQVIRRKKPLGKRFSEFFFGSGEHGSVIEYVLIDILIPAAKDAIADSVTQGIEWRLFGSSHNRGRGSGRGRGGYTNYGRYSRNERRDPRDREDKPRMSRRARERFDFDEIILPTRREAQEILEQLFYILEKFEEVTVEDLYKLAGEPVEWTDDKWGWTDLGGARVQRISHGYLLDLPRPEPLD